MQRRVQRSKHQTPNEAFFHMMQRKNIEKNSRLFAIDRATRFNSSVKSALPGLTLEWKSFDQETYIYCTKVIFQVSSSIFHL